MFLKPVGHSPRREQGMLPACYQSISAYLFLHYDEASRYRQRCKEIYACKHISPSLLFPQKGQHTKSCQHSRELIQIADLLQLCFQHLVRFVRMDIEFNPEPDGKAQRHKNCCTIEKHVPRKTARRPECKQEQSDALHTLKKSGMPGFHVSTASADVVVTSPIDLPFRKYRFAGTRVPLPIVLPFWNHSIATGPR